MKKWEYEIKHTDPENLFSNINISGSEGWEFVFAIIGQKILPSKLLGQPPVVTSDFILIFKREKDVRT